MNVRLLVVAAMAVMAGCTSDDCVKTVAMRRPDSPSCRMSKLPYKIGIARYTMCARTLDEALAILHNIDCHYLGLMEGTLKYDATDAEIADYKARCAAYGVEIASAGPEYFSTEEQCRALFAFAKRYGMKYVSVVPFEMRVVDGKKTRCESEAMLDVLEKCVKEYGIRAAIHNHGPDIPHLFPTAEAVMKRIGNRDRRIGVCLDVGHERRAGLDPAAFILKNPERIVEVHLKNIKIDPVKNYAMEGPRGELDIFGILKALDAVRFNGFCLIEFEKDFECNSEPLAESVGYYRGIMDSIEQMNR